MYKFSALSIFLFFTSQALAVWNFNLEDELGTIVQSNRLIFPVTFSQSNCQFTFKIIDDNGQIKNSTLTHTGGCFNNHRLLLDNYWYEWSTGFTFIFEQAQWSSFGTISLGSCSTESGNAIITGSPFLFINSSLFKIDTSKEVKYFTNNAISYISLNSVNGDIVCTNGTIFSQNNPPGADLIFENEFE